MSRTFFFYDGINNSLGHNKIKLFQTFRRSILGGYFFQKHTSLELDRKSHPLPIQFAAIKLYLLQINDSGCRGLVAEVRADEIDAAANRFIRRPYSGFFHLVRLDCLDEAAIYVENLAGCAGRGRN